MTGSVTVPAPRYPALDGVRGLAILAVLIVHTLRMPVVNRVDAWVANLAQSGFVGVDLFFVLSGFLITGILLDTRDSPHYFRDFYARRTLRIFPVYYVALLGMVLFVPGAVGGHLRETQGWHWAYLVNVYLVGHQFSELPLTGHFWSLALEEQFYLVWPVIVWTLPVPLLRRFTWMVLVGAAVLRAALWAAYAADLVPESIVMANIVMMPLRADALAAGAIIALALRTSDGRARLRRFVLPLAVVSLSVLAVIWLRFRHFVGSAPEVQLAGFSAVIGVSCSLIIASVLMPSSRLALTLSSSPLRFLGKYSYALYIVHQPVAFALAEYAPKEPLGDSGLAAGVLFFVVTNSVSVGIAMLSWRTLEAPLLSLKRYFESPGPGMPRSQKATEAAESAVRPPSV
jgi:peptidoglycan/LPS O-acetylase OafA/YrhL